jgi:hypothetical protein
MATQRFIGNTSPVAQVDTLTPSTATSGVFTVTINGKAVSYTATGATVPTITAALTASCNASTHAEFMEITFADITTAITATADTAGKPFTITTSATTGTFTKTQPTTCTGPKFWSAATNWSAGVVPASTDDIVLDNWSGDILYGLDQNTVTVTTMIVTDTFTGNVGLPKTNTDGNAYAEYRDDFLKLSVTTLHFAGKSTRFKLNTGSVAGTLNITNTGTSAETGLKTFQWKGTNATNVVNISKGSFAAAQFGGEVATIATLNQSWKTSQTSDSDVFLGPGVTLTTIKKTGGTLTLQSTVSTLTNSGGETIAANVGGIATLTLDGGQLRYNSTGTIATATISNGGEFDKRQDARACAFTALTLRKGAVIRDPNKTINFPSTGFGVQSPLADITLDLGSNFTLFRAT